MQALSHSLRWRILLGTGLFAIPCLLLTANLVREADAPAPAAFGATETAQELAVVCPGFEEYTVGNETAVEAGDTQGRAELVAHVSTNVALDEEARKVAEDLIRIDVPEIDRVEFSVAAS